jgi:hypothetical protein
VPNERRNHRDHECEQVVRRRRRQPQRFLVRATRPNYRADRSQRIGKTTLFNSIVGYHPIDSGSIRFEGQEISQLRVQEIARLGLLRTFQTTRIYGKMSCLQNMQISIPHRKAGFFDMFAYERRTSSNGPNICCRLWAFMRSVFCAREPLVRPAKAARVCHGAHERADGPAAR